MGDVFSISPNGFNATLLTFSPNWLAGVTVSHRWPSRLETGESGKERRAPQSASLRLTVSYEVHLTESEAEELRNMLGGLEAGERVAIPLWPDSWAKADYSANRRYDPEYVVNYTEGSGANVYAADSIPGSLTYARLAPLLVGSLASEAQFVAIGEDQAVMRLTIEEDSPYSLRIGIKDFSVPSYWPTSIDPDWVSEVTEVSQNGYKRETVGDLRVSQVDGNDRVNWWERTASFTLFEDEIGEFLQFFEQQQGRVKSFDAPAWFAPGTTSADAPHGFVSRYASENIELRYTTPNAAQCLARFVTLPWETSSSAEFQKPQRVKLYKFRYLSPTPYVWRFTDHESNLSNSEGTWTSAPFELASRATKDLELNAREWRIKSHSFSGNPLNIWHPYGPEAPMEITVYEADLDSLNDTEIIRFGRIQDVEQESRSLEATCSFWGNFLESVIPGVRIQHKCNWKLFSSKCGLSKASFKETGTISGKSGRQVTVSGSGEANGYFAGGFLEVSNGLNYERRIIVSSTKSGSSQVLQLDRELRINGNGASASYYPGCDKRGSTCRSKFNNHTNFGGFEWIREENLSTQQPKNMDGGKK